MDLVEQGYRLTSALPSEEKHGLVSQIRRVAVSVAANIAEGQGRSHTKEFLNHLSMARGSLVELETLLLVCQRFGYLTEVQLTPAQGLSAEVGRMLTGLRHALEAKLSRYLFPIHYPLTPTSNGRRALHHRAKGYG